MPQPHEAHLIRIFNAHGLAVGAGFLTDDTHALTCAHVVVSAMDLKAYSETPPPGELTLDFPLVAPNETLTARVVAWEPPQPGQGDVAVLELTSLAPTDAAPARLIQSTDLWHHTFRAFGFPKGHENGTWATGRILGAKAGGWQQIESTEQSGYFIQPGFSGGPVWDERLGGVVGMIMEADRSATVRAAFLSPVDVLATAYPPLAEKIEQIISPASDAPAPGEPPFKGLRYFDVQDAPLFFGRETLTTELVQRISPSPWQGEGRGEGGNAGNYLAIVGASGSGKSSLARAGLIPALLAEHPDWVTRVITPTAHPLKELAVTLTNPSEGDLAVLQRQDAFSKDPRSLDIAASRFLKQQTASGSGGVDLRSPPHLLPHLLLVVDQFEELFTACKDLAERKTFIDNLLYAAFQGETPGVFTDNPSGRDPSSKPPGVLGVLTIVLTLRADFYHHCALYD
ncbi:MAG TPA: trypsin-like peptidase domain-containing protein, partial [Anaerolineales bacterium]|nr:trypsin-like peptidase domain-containing protein [Anaerolineales bacterium]